MAVRRNTQSSSSAAGKAAGATQSKAAAKAAADRQKALDGLHPAAAEFFKKNFRLDITKLDIATLYDLQSGRLTKPLDLVVTPIVYDRGSKEQIKMPAIKVVASVRALFPYEDGKPVDLDGKERKVFLVTVPCRPMLEKSEGGESIDEGTVPETEARENPTFTEEQLRALEGIGIERSRLFGGFNHLSKEEKLDILDGREFVVDGAVRTEAGIVNVIGTAVLGGSPDDPQVSFEPEYPQERTPEKVIDLLAARINGTLELDFFRRSADGRVITNVQGQPILNEAGTNLVRYGMAMQPVRGYNHVRRYDEKEGKYVDKVEAAWYQVTAVNGNLYATRMKEAKVKGKDGKDIIVPQVSQARVDLENGRVFIEGKSDSPLEFASEQDRKDFLEGRGGVVRGAVYHDFKHDRDIEYDAFVVADNTRAGFAHQFTPETSKVLIERRDKRRNQGQKTVRKQNYGLGV